MSASISEVLIASHWRNLLHSPVDDPAERMALISDNRTLRAV